MIGLDFLSCTRHQGYGEPDKEDRRVIEVMAYALGRAGIPPALIEGRILKAHDHKGHLTITLNGIDGWIPDRLIEAIREAWCDVGNEQRENVTIEDGLSE